jgi:hypothetical protein
MNVQKTTVTAIFDGSEEAAKAFDQLQSEGIPRNAVSVVLADDVHEPGPDADESKAKVEREEVRASRGARLGAIVGASGMSLGAAALAIPGIIAAGPLAAVLVAAGAGALSGGALGALIGIGVSRDVAEVYHRTLEGGAVMLGVEVEKERGEEVVGLLTRCGGRSIMQVAYAE